MVDACIKAGCVSTFSIDVVIWYRSDTVREQKKWYSRISKDSVQPFTSVAFGTKVMKLRSTLPNDVKIERVIFSTVHLAS